MPTPGDEDVTTESGEDYALEASIARFEEVKKAIASINLDNEDSSSGGRVGRLDRLHLLCTYLAEDIQGGALIKSPFQLARLFSLVMQHIAPGCIPGLTSQRYDLMLATITMNCIMRNAIHHSWERILLQLLRSDLATDSSPPGGNRGEGLEEGWVGKLYNVALPLLIECSVNDDCIGMKRIDSQYEIIGCSILHFVDELGWTLLHHAVHNKSTRVIKYLISECHFSVNESSKDACKLAPLHIASSHHFYGVIEILLDLGASRELHSGKNETPLDLLLSSSKSSASGNSKSLFQSIYYLLSSVDDLWSSCSEGCMLCKICQRCDASVVEEVGTLASQSNSQKWNLDYIVQSIGALLRRGIFVCAISLLQKFQDFVFEMTKLTEASGALSILLNEVLKSASIQSIITVCDILGPTIQYERLGFLTVKQLCSHINAAVLRGDLLLCKHIVENIFCESDYVYQRGEIQIDGPRDWSTHGDTGTLMRPLMSISPMLMAIYRHDAAVTNLLMTFGDPELLKESSIDLLLGGTIAGSIDCLKLLRSGLGDVRFYKGLLGMGPSQSSPSISPLTVIGNFLRTTGVHMNLPCNQMVSLFFEVEKYVLSSGKAVTALSAGEFVIHNNGKWDKRSKVFVQISQAFSDFEVEFRRKSNSVFAPKEINGAKFHINRCKEYWQFLGPALESKKFTTSMRIAFRTKSDQAMNRVANLILSLSDFEMRRGNGVGWPCLLQQFSGLSIDSKVSKLQSYLLKFKPRFISAEYVPESSEPFLNEKQWDHIKSSLSNFQADVLSNIDTARQALEYSSPTQLSIDILVMWLHLLVAHDDFFYADGTHETSYRSELLAVAAVELMKERYQYIVDYHRSLDRSALSLPSNAVSMALLSLLQLFFIQDVTMDDVETQIKRFKQILALAQSELHIIDSKSNRTVQSHDRINFEEFVCVLIEEVMRFYFIDLINCSSGNTERSFDYDIEETVMKLLVSLLLPVTELNLWVAANSLLRNIVTVSDKRSYSYSKGQLYRLCTEIICTQSEIKSEIDLQLDLFAAVVISPIDFAVKSCNIEFLSTFYSLFPETRLEKDVVSASLCSSDSHVSNRNLSFLFSNDVLDTFEYDEDIQSGKTTGRSYQCNYRVNQDIQNWFLKMANDIDAKYLDMNLLPGDRYRISRGSDAAFQYKLYSGSSHGLCENLNSEIILSDGRLLCASKFVEHINNYLFALPAPMGARGQHLGSIYLHTIFKSDVPAYIIEFVLEWASFSNVRLRYLASNRAGFTPLYVAINRVDLEVARKFIKSSTHNSKFCDYIAPGFLNHTSHIRKVDLNAMFIESAVINSQKTRALLGTISDAPSRGEMLSATLQRNFAEIRKLWLMISKIDFRQLFAVMYSSSGSTLDSVIQVKMIMSSLGIPTSRLGINPAELNTNSSMDAAFDALFLNVCPSKLSHFISFKKAMDVKSSIVRWINLRCIDLQQSTSEAEYLFHRRADLSLLALGLLGTHALGSTSPEDWEIDHDSLMKLGRSETRILSKQIAEETNTILHYPRFIDRENNCNLGNTNNDTSLNSSTSADSLQYTLKLAYLLLEFFRQVCRARLMISISNTNADGKHPLDKVVDNARLAALYEKHVTSTVHALCDGNGILTMGIRSTFPFFHSVTVSEFCDAIHRIIMIDTVDKSLRGVCETIYLTLISLLRLIGEFSISESLIALKKMDSGQSYLQAKFPENVYSSLFSTLKTLTIQCVLEANANNSDVDCKRMVSEIVVNGEMLKTWSDIPNFFTSLQTYPSLEESKIYNLTDRQLYLIQCIGSSLVHISALLPLKDYYLENDVQSLIQRNVFNPLCALCTTTVNTSSKADQTDVCSHLLEIGMKTVEPDGNNQIALIMAVLLGKAHIVSLIFRHISTSSIFNWNLLNGKASTFADVYFQKNSPFRYIVWNVLMMCPSRGGSDNAQLCDEYQQIALTLIKTTNKFSFPCDTPPDACFSCLDLAALKQLPEVLEFLCHQVDLFSVGSKVTETTMKHSYRGQSLYGNTSSLRRTYFYILLSDSLPVISLDLLARNALSVGDIRKAFTVDELWPSDFELTKTVRSHVHYIQRSGICPVDQNIANMIEDVKTLLISSVKCLHKGKKKSYFSSNILGRTASSIGLFESIYIAIASKEKNKIIHVLHSMLWNDEDDNISLPTLLFHVASYYNRVNTVDTYLTRYAPQLLRNFDLNKKEYFDLMHRVCTPLDVAIKCSNIASVRTLLSMECSVDWSHFLHACIQGSAEIALLLLTCLEDSMSDNDMKHALNDSLLPEEISAKVPRNTPLLTCICRRGVEDTSITLLVERLLSLGADVNAIDDYGMTCVNYAASLGCKNLTHIILRWTYDDARIEPNKKARLEKSLSKLCSLVRKFLLRRHRRDKDEMKV